MAHIIKNVGHSEVNEQVRIMFDTTQFIFLIMSNYVPQIYINKAKKTKMWLFLL